MKFLKMAIIICPLLLFVSGCAGETTPQESQKVETQATNEEMNGVFRYSNWGDTIEQVEKAEGSNYYTNGPELILYRDIKLLTYNTNTIYFFDENQLDSACYEITENHTNNELHIEDFEDIDKALQVKYGKPDIQEEEWYNDILKDTPGLALFMGDVKYVTIWQTDNAEIMHTLSADNNEVQHIIFYANPDKEYAIDTKGL